jgi:hypothetical protein
MGFATAALVKRTFRIMIQLTQTDILRVWCDLSCKIILQLQK